MLRIIPEALLPLLALTELGRRCVWGFFRLEHEHVSNAFQHRREQSFVPSHFRRPVHIAAPRRIQSFFESFAIVVIVLTMLARVSLNAAKLDHIHVAEFGGRDAYGHGAHNGTGA